MISIYSVSFSVTERRNRIELSRLPFNGGVLIVIIPRFDHRTLALPLRIVLPYVYCTVSRSK